MRIGTLVTLAILAPIAVWAGLTNFGRTVDRRGDTRECQVHRVAMPMKTVRIGYGLLGYRKGYRDAKAAEFPNSVLFVPGGCMVGWSTHARVRSCPECERAEGAWNEAHAAEPYGRE